MSLSSFAFGVILFLSPCIASAKQETALNFQQGIPGTWEKGPCLSAQQSPEGFALATTTERCSIFRATRDLRHPIETLSLTVLSPTQTEIVFLWHRQGTPNNHMVELPLVLQSLDGPQTMDLNLPRYPQWDPSTDRIGFALPKNSSFILQNITFTQWSLRDKTLAAFRSFWTFDTFRPYAINFLWGPVIGWNPVWQEQLFASIPPVGWSASRAFLSLLLPLGALCLLLCSRRQWKPSTCRSASILFGTMFVGFWLLFDVRMGLELLSYVRTDWATFLLKPPSERHFRVFENFNAIAEESIPLLNTSPQYGFVGPRGAPFGSLMRYYTYPVRPLSPSDPEEQRAHLRHWLVAFRDDARISPQGELFLGNTLLAGPGVIVKEFGQDAFLFEVTDPAPSP